MVKAGHVLLWNFICCDCIVTFLHINHAMEAIFKFIHVSSPVDFGLRRTFCQLGHQRVLLGRQRVSNLVALSEMVDALDSLSDFPLILTLIKNCLIKETIHIFLVLL